MPYIVQDRRFAILPLSSPAQTAGELNFQITTLLNRYLDDEKESYARYNDAIGALESAKMELYRRMVVPYENQKITDNGDVYNLDSKAAEEAL